MRKIQRIQQRKKPLRFAHQGACFHRIADEARQAAHAAQLPDERLEPAAVDPADHSRQVRGAFERRHELRAVDRQLADADVKPQFRGLAGIAVAEHIERGDAQARTRGGLREHPRGQPHHRDEWRMRERWTRVHGDSASDSAQIVTRRAQPRPAATARASSKACGKPR
jgi:hypothetical protein